ncbi:MAG: phage terminase small subunit [Lachnospiraceae bacterium]
MARAPDERITKAYDLYKQGMKLVEIASQLNLPEGTVRRWKCTHKWDGERSDRNSERSVKKQGGQPGNNNAVGHGAPKQNSNAEKHGFFSKYLPKETLGIIREMPENPLNILWDNIQIQYAAIIRAQQIMYVTDKDDVTTTKNAESYGATMSVKWEVQQAWDKQGNFLQAQSRAMKTLEGMISKYDDILHKNWDMTTEEQRARIDSLKSKIDSDQDVPIQITFTKASEKHGGEQSD